MIIPRKTINHYHTQKFCVGFVPDLIFVKA